MAAASEKIQAISRLAFPITLQDLQHYLGLTGWMRDYVPYYAQIMKLLQLRKTEMLQGLAKSGTSGKQRKQAARSTRLVEPTDKERAFFNCLQGILSKGGFLHYFNSNRHLYINLDYSKRGVGVIVYHVKGDPDPEKATDICKTDI
ncbi:reverse partial [Lasallia pustulata]|uniref:Reverse partial n=1 Tax=Lasallia pustulata TaxID=136370 RepID=A0A1W5CWI8_9LECA|nr:reverse partial [Lasallia pustulata]